MKLTHLLAVVALSASLGACIIAPHRPYMHSVNLPAPIAVTPAPVYYEPAPLLQVLPYVGLGWWVGRYWGHNNHVHHGHYNGRRH